jgi:hypothetical protein
MIVESARAKRYGPPPRLGCPAERSAARIAHQSGGPQTAESHKSMMIQIDTPDFDVNAVMCLLGGVETNLVLAGTWNRMPWRIWLHEPSDTLSPAHWVLEMGDHRYPLCQASHWEQNDETKSWEQAKSTWRLRSMDGRWIPALRDLGADLTIDD